MGYWQAALVKMGVAQPGPKITSHDRAVLECVICAHNFYLTDGTVSSCSEIR